MNPYSLLPKIRYLHGGVISVNDGDLIPHVLLFLAIKQKLVVEPFICTSPLHQLGDVYFEENSATIGGAIGAVYSSLITDDKVWFINNVADNKGGAISFPEVNDIVFNNEQIFLSGNFLSNKAKYGGAIFFENRCREGSVIIRNINVTANSESCLWISGCNIRNL